MIANFETFFRPTDHLVDASQRAENQIFNQIMSLLKPFAPADSAVLKDWVISVMPSVTSETARQQSRGISPTRCSGLEICKSMKTLRFQYVDIQSDTSTTKALHATLDIRSLSTTEILLLADLFGADLPSVNPIIGWFHCKFHIEKHDGYDQELEWMVSRLTVGAWISLRDACRKKGAKGFRLPVSIILLYLYMKFTNDDMARCERDE